MNNRFFSGLAIRNIRSNTKLYLPYMLSSVAVTAMFHLMVSLLTNEFVQERSSTLPTLFAFGTIVIGIFSFIFILYTNSFLIKRRKKEIGLYGILGLEKRHVAKVLFFETVFTSLTSIAAGLLCGWLFGRLFFLLLNYLMNLPVQIEYSTSPLSALITAGLFLGIFLLAFLYNVSQFTFAKPVKLLKGSNEGEKEPKGSVILFILSLISLGSGYWISVTIEDPLSALSQFFIAVLLVIFGTYLLFISGSIFILKALKKNKRFYYRPGAFISVSGMLYRMKQNAVGLANICILASMVIIAVSTTVTLFAGTEETLHNRFPAENNFTLYGGEGQQTEEMDELYRQLGTQFEDEAEARGLDITFMEQYRMQTLYGELDGNRLTMQESFAGGEVPLIVGIIPLEDYNAMAKEPAELSADEALLYYSEGAYKESELSVGGKTYQLREAEAGVAGSDQAITESMLLVVPELADIEAITEFYREKHPDAMIDTLTGNFSWDTDGTEEEKEAYGERMRQIANYGTGEKAFANYESRDHFREEWYSTNGGFLFLGIFLGLLFTLGTVLITYFKQVSEGFDDRRKFQIMQKVGLDEDMIRDSTRSQLIWMFFLPILTAAIHVLFAYPIVRQMLVLFGITSERTWLLSFAGVVIAFGLIYFLIYRVTSRVYYSIVK